MPEPEVRPSGTTRTSLTPDEEALDLLEIAGRPLLKRVAPVLGGLAALLLLGWLIRRLTADFRQKAHQVRTHTLNWGMPPP